MAEQKPTPQSEEQKMQTFVGELEKMSDELNDKFRNYLIKVRKGEVPLEDVETTVDIFLKGFKQIDRALSISKD